MAHLCYGYGLIEEGLVGMLQGSLSFGNEWKMNHINAILKNVCNVSFILLYNDDLLEKIRGE